MTRSELMVQNLAVNIHELNEGDVLKKVKSFSSHGAGPLWLSGLVYWLSRSACWPDGLMALTGLGSNPGLEESFSARLG